MYIEVPTNESAIETRVDEFSRDAKVAVAEDIGRLDVDVR